MVLGQYMAVLVGTWWYWVIKGQYWAVLGFILDSLIVVREALKILSFLGIIPK